MTIKGHDAKKSYVIINPTVPQHEFEGFGVSLCWWANMCGNWSDEKIDEIIDWLVSPEGLNYRIFRYNIGGGDDPENRNCTPHHMAEGKGIRAEMEGFKDSPDGDYIWTRDAAQRKILLKIKEKRPDAVFEAFSNSCPWWMTYSGCCAGNFTDQDNLRPEYYEEFARYLIDVCKHYKDVYDVEFQTIAPFNEPQWSGWLANGGQEGCNFEPESQVKFIKVLSDVINESGLDIKIAAPDLSFGYLYTSNFEVYEASKIVNLIDKYNVHTYVTSNAYRSKLDVLCERYKLPLWVSETGPLWEGVPAGTRRGIVGNLYMAKRLIEDFKYLRPTAWLDWQYVEETGNQWCLVRSESFSEESYTKVKNYSVRSHFSRFIKKDYNILPTLNDNTLAAHSPTKDELVIVTVNPDTTSINFTLNLSMYEHIEDQLIGYITTESKDLEEFRSYELVDKELSFILPEKSILTFIIPIGINDNLIDNKIQDEGTYLIYARAAEEKVLGCVNESVKMQLLDFNMSQIWQLSLVDNKIMLKNEKGEIITRTRDGSLICSKVEDKSNQLFELQEVGDRYFQIKDTKDNKYLMSNDWDFSEETVIGFGNTGEDATATKSHWGFLKLVSADTSINIDPENEIRDILRIDTSLPGSISISKETDIRCEIELYSLSGQRIFSTHSYDRNINISLTKGFYFLLCKTPYKVYKSKLVIN